MAAKAVGTRTEEVLRAARRAAPGATPLMFLDEPGLTAALDPGFPLGVDDTLDLVSSALAAIEERAIAGLHCCGRADWPVVLQAGPQMLSLPVGAGAVDHPGAFADYLERGGWLAWGAVPTDRPLGESAEILWRRLVAEWDGLAEGGCEPAGWSSRRSSPRPAGSWAWTWPRPAASSTSPATWPSGSRPGPSNWDLPWGPEPRVPR